MAEENKEVVIEKKEEENTGPTETEQRALSMGWNPDKYDKADENYIDAKEFVRRKPLFDRIEQTTKRLRTVEETLNNLASHHQKVKEVEYQRALKTLREEKRAALKDGDTIKALEVEDQMDEMYEGHQQEVAEIRQNAAIEAQRNAQGPSQDFQNWVKVNDWYLKDEDMHDFADGTAAAFINRAKASGKTLTEQEVFDHVQDKIKKAYPEKFTNPNRDRPGTVVNGDRNGKGGKGTYSPNDAERAVAKQFVRQGVYKTEQEYFKELQALQEDA